MYAERIRKCFEGGDPGEFNVRHIEAAMRLASSDGCLDSLSGREFITEVFRACSVVKELGPEDAEKLAQSFGL